MYISEKNQNFYGRNKKVTYGYIFLENMNYVQ